MFIYCIDKVNNLNAVTQKYINFPKWFTLVRYFLSII